MSQSRQLAAIMFTDIVGYTAMMERDEENAFRILDKNREIQRPIIDHFQGRWLKEMGDGILASFTTVSDAVYCAGAIQKACENEPELFVRIGIHEGEVVFKDEDVFGSGVNIASRLESISPIGGILVSGSVYREIKNKQGIKAEFLREETLKNVDEPIKIYQVHVERNDFPETTPTPSEPPPTIKGKKGLIVGAAVIILLLLGYVAYHLQSNELAETAPIPAEVKINKSIAVLPFANMNNDTEQQYFSDGIMESILNNLTKIEQLKVISRTSVMQYRDTKKTSPQIGEELGVAYLLEGGVQSFEGKVRIHAQLIDAVQDKHIWSENYDRDLTDIFLLQSEIAQKIASELNTVLSPREIEGIQIKGTDNLEAYNLYMMGRYFWYKRTEDGVRKSVDYFEQSLVNDPDYALAYAGLADAYLILAAYGWLPYDEGFSKAREQVLKALEIDSDLAEAHATLGTLAKREGRWEEAEKELKRAIALDPNYAIARHWYAEYLEMQGQIEEGRQQIDRGLDVDPLSFLLRQQSAYFYYNAGELEMSLKEYQKQLDLNSGRVDNYGMSIVYLELGRDEESFERLKILFSADSSKAKYTDKIENIYTEAGIEGVLRLLVDFEINKTPNYPYWIAMQYGVIGEYELALEWLEKAHKSYYVPLKSMRMYDSLRSNPRFIMLLERIGLED